MKYSDSHIKDFIDDDILEDDIETYVEELFKKINKISEKNKNTPKTDNEILRIINSYFSNMGLWDSAIDEFLKHDIYLKLDGIALSMNSENPFSKKHLRQIIANKFNMDIEDDRELVANMIYMYNRMAKIPEMFTKKIGWDQEKRRNLYNILNYCKQNSYTTKNGIYDKETFDNAIKSNKYNVTFEEFCLFNKLHYCSSVCYCLKHKKINEAIEKKYVEDFSEFDKLDGNDNYKILRIDVPGYNIPYFPHVHKKDYEKDTGINIDKQNILRCDEEFSDRSAIFFKMSEEQREFIKSLEMQRVYFSNMPYYRYMKESIMKIEHQEMRQEKIREREERRRRSMKEVQSTGKLKISIAMMNAKKELDERMYKHLLTMCEGLSDEKILETYKQKIEEQGDKETRYNTNTYKRIRKYVDYINEEDNLNYTEEQKVNETNNIYVFMKISEQYVRGCQRDKNNQGDMKKAYDSYKIGFNSFKNNVKNGKSLEEIHKDAISKKTIKKPKEPERNISGKSYKRKTTGKKSIQDYTNEDLKIENTNIGREIKNTDVTIDYLKEREALLEEYSRLKKELQEKQNQLKKLTDRILELEEEFSKNNEERNK